MQSSFSLIISESLVKEYEKENCNDNNGAPSEEKGLKSRSLIIIKCSKSPE